MVISGVQNVNLPQIKIYLEINATCILHKIQKCQQKRELLIGNREERPVKSLPGGLPVNVVSSRTKSVAGVGGGRFKARTIRSPC
jgi:hypothetical protein